MKIIILLLIVCGFSFVKSQFGLLNSLFGQNGGGDVSNNVWSCPLHRCRNVDKRKYLIERRLSPNFPYHHLQHLRRPNTHYTLVGTNIGSRGLVESYVQRPGAFLAYDSEYDPIYDPCTDCDGSGYGGEYCMYGKCYISRTYLIGRN